MDVKIVFWILLTFALSAVQGRVTGRPEVTATISTPQVASPEDRILVLRYAVLVPSCAILLAALGLYIYKSYKNNSRTRTVRDLVEVIVDTTGGQGLLGQSLMDDSDSEEELIY